MRGYVIVSVDIKDPVRYEDYRKMVPASLAPYGGRFLVRGGRVHVLEGQRQPGRCVILEFPTIEQAQAWYDSPEYAPAKALRLARSIPCSDPLRVFDCQTTDVRNAGSMRTKRLLDSGRRWCTGYTPEFRWLDLARPATRHGFPIQDRRIVESVRTSSTTSFHASCEGARQG